jgi:hypothetical protein
MTGAVALVGLGGAAQAEPFRLIVTDLETPLVPTDPFRSPVRELANAQTTISQWLSRSNLDGLMS